MIAPALGRWMLGALLAGLASSPILAEPRSQDPWSSVPALPTGCYSAQDHFYDDVGAADTALAAAIERQKATNEQIRQTHQAIDPMEQQQRMQRYLMKHPQEAIKLMQQQQAVGAALPGAVNEDGERSRQLEAELNALLAKYDAALSEAYAPADAKQKAIVAKVEAQGFAIDGEGAPAWALDQIAALDKEKQKAYEGICPRWWAASGSLHGWLARYRDWLVKEHIPYLQQIDDQAVAQYAIMGTDASAFHSTAAMESVRDYMAHASKVFGHRLEARP